MNRIREHYAMRFYLNILHFHMGFNQPVAAGREHAAHGTYPCKYQHIANITAYKYGFELQQHLSKEKPSMEVTT